MKSFAIACSTMALGAEAVRLSAEVEADAKKCPLDAGFTVGEYTVGGAVGSQKWKATKKVATAEVNALFGKATTLPASILGADGMKLFRLKKKDKLTKAKAINAFILCKVAHGDSGLKLAEVEAEVEADVEAEIEAAKCPLKAGTKVAGEFTVGGAVGSQAWKDSAKIYAEEVDALMKGAKSVPASKLPKDAQKLFGVTTGNLTRAAAIARVTLCKVAHGDSGIKLAETEAEIEAEVEMEAEAAKCPVAAGTKIAGEFTVGGAVGSQKWKDSAKIYAAEVDALLKGAKSVPASKLPKDAQKLFGMTTGTLTRAAAIARVTLCKVAHGDSGIKLAETEAEIEAEVEMEAEAAKCPVAAGTKIAGEFTVGGAVGSQKWKDNAKIYAEEVDALMKGAKSVPASKLPKDAQKLFGVTTGNLTRAAAIARVTLCKVAHGDSGIKLAELEAEVDAELEAEVDAELEAEAEAELDAEIEAELEAATCPVKAGTKIDDYTVGGAIKSQKWKASKKVATAEIKTLFGGKKSIKASILPANMRKLFGVKKTGTLTQAKAVSIFMVCKVAHGEAGLAEIEVEEE